MGSKKDIGKVFQEKFKDFEQAPDAGAWDAIAAGLDGKSSNRYFIPLWITMGTIVLVSLVGLLFWQPWDSNTEDSRTEVVVTTVQNEDNASLQKNDSSNYRLNPNASTVQSTEANSSISNNINGEAVSADTIPNGISTSNTAVTTGTKNSANSSIAKQKESLANTKSSITTPSNTSTKSYVALQKARKGNLNNNVPAPFDTSSSENTVRAQNAPGIVKLDKTTKALLIERERNAREAYKLRISKEKEAREATRLAQIASELKKRDSIAQATKAQALAQQEKKAKNKKKSQSKSAAEKAVDRKEAVTYKFAVSPYASLLSYGSLAKGSSIDDRLVDNPREAISTQGYGIRLEYNLSEKASFRFGVGVSPLKYQTNNFQVLNNGGTINVYQFSGLTPTQLEQGGTPTNPEAVAFFNNYDVVTIEQNISYLEVPLDYQYKLINKRIGLSINPGVSIFILTDNNVFAIANDNTRLRIGRETSLNDLSFAFNIGVGGHYNFAKHWRLDLEPTFRYQLNPYSNSLSNFKPYYLGLQFGATYKF